MDFKNNKYYLIRNKGIFDSFSPHELKIKFPCKIRYGFYVCDNKYYSYCVSINASLADDLKAYISSYDKSLYEEVYSDPNICHDTYRKWISHKEKIEREVKVERMETLFNLLDKTKEEIEYD